MSKTDMIGELLSWVWEHFIHAFFSCLNLFLSFIRAKYFVISTDRSCFTWTQKNIQVVGITEQPSTCSFSSEALEQTGGLLKEYATLLNAVNLLGRDLLYKLRAILQARCFWSSWEARYLSYWTCAYLHC